MSQTQLLMLVGALVALLLVFPLIMVVVIQRLLPVRSEIPATQPVVEEAQGQFEGLSDFWSAMVPHLIELRTRLTRALIGVIIGTVVGFVLVLPGGPVELLEIIIRQFVCSAGETVGCVQAVATTESFTSHITVALTIGVIIAMPVIVYQLIAFIAPGLTNTEKRYLFAALPFITSFFLAGILFGWFVTIPAALQFLLDFGGNQSIIEIKPTLRDFISIFTTLLLINGFIFELPLIIYVLALVGGVTPEFLAKNRRYAALIIVILAAIITPTGDPINLALVAVPMYVLFEFGIVLARFAPRRKLPSAPTA
jgi:sec-independent protein translocase protein TatC